MEDNNRFYNRSESWGNTSELYQGHVLVDILKILPRDIQSVLDVGCGDGVITNAIPQSIRTVGIDISEEALKYVTREKRTGSIDKIPFPDHSFDLVMANDVIEHLPEQSFQTAINELQRVAKKYVLITVPFMENLAAGQTWCNHCQTEYHVNQHFRSFTIDKLQSLLTGNWAPICHVVTGAEAQYELPELIRFRERLGFRFEWESAVCPNCLNRNTSHTGIQNSLHPQELESILNAIRINTGRPWNSRTECITLFKKLDTGEEVSTYNIFEGVVDREFNPLHPETIHVESNRIYFDKPELYQLQFLPRKHPRPYFTIGEHKYEGGIEGITLKKTQSLKFGFYQLVKSDLVIEGYSAAKCHITVCSYDGDRGYKQVCQIAVEGAYRIPISANDTSSISEYGNLFELHSDDGEEIIVSKAYYVIAGTKELLFDVKNLANAEYVQIEMNRVRTLLSIAWYNGLSPTTDRFRAILKSVNNVDQTNVIDGLLFQYFMEARKNSSDMSIVQQALIPVQSRTDEMQQTVYSMQSRTEELQQKVYSVQSKTEEIQREASSYYQLTAQNSVKIMETIDRMSDMYHKSLNLSDSLLQSQAEAEETKLAVHTLRNELEAANAIVNTQKEELEATKLLVQSLQSDMERIRQEMSLIHSLKKIYWKFRARFLSRGIRFMATIRNRTKAVYDESTLFEPSVVHDQYLQEQERNPAKSYLMICHDQEIDRRIIQEAQSLQLDGWKGIIVALSFDAEDKLDEDSGIPIHRIGLKRIIPDCKVYRNYNVRQYWILNQIYNLGHLLTRGKVPKLVGASFKIASKLNHLTYRAGLVRQYRNRTIYHPLPFTRCFYAAAKLYPSELVFAHDLTALRAAAQVSEAWGSKLVYDCHELYPEQKVFSKPQYRMLVNEERSLIDKADLVMIASHGSANVLRERYPSVRERVKVLLNATNLIHDVNPLQPKDLLREKLGLSKDEKIVLYQGGITYNRNLDVLVQGFIRAKLANAHLIFMGPAINDYVDKLKKWSGELLDKNIHFIAPVTQDVLLHYTTSADFGVIPYAPTDLNTLYCMPNKLFEYLLAGLPIMYNNQLKDVGWFLQEIAKTGRGVNFHSVKDIADAFTELLCQDLSAIRKHLVDNRGEFLWKKQSDDLRRFIKEIYSGVDWVGKNSRILESSY